MKSRVLFALLAVALLAAGCSSDNNSEWQRVVCSVQNINDGAPVVSAALDVTDPANPVVPLDMINVLFWARPGNSMMNITEEGPYSAFIVTSYDAVWTPGPGAPAELTTYNVERAQLSARVPINDEIEVAFLLVPQEIKQEPWYPAGDAIYTANLQLTFYGHDEGSSHEVAIPAGVSVTFLGAITQN